MELPEEWLNFLREQFPEGSRVQLSEAADTAYPIQPGSVGVLTGIDERGQFYVTWEDGQSSCLAFAADQFKVLPPKPETLKFYMPLTAEVFERDEYGDLNDDDIPLDSKDLLAHEDAIVASMVRERLQEEGDQGMMHWYDKPDSVKEKVQSAVFTAESRDGKLWGVVKCQVRGTLTAKELDTLRDYLTGQASDGFGEGYEQREIEVENGEMYVHLWQSGNSWSMETEAERFGTKPVKGLPPMCFSVRDSTGELVAISRGEHGCLPLDLGTDDRAQNEAIAERENAKLGVTPEQRVAMKIGSLCGWQSPGADPKTYAGRLPNREPPSPQKADAQQSEAGKKRRGPSR